MSTTPTPLDTDRAKAAALMRRIVPHTSTIWARDPSKYPLGGIMKPLEDVHEYTSAVEALSKIVHELRLNIQWISTNEIVGGLRSMSSVRDEIGEWYDLLEESKAELERREDGLSKRLLIGL